MTAAVSRANGDEARLWAAALCVSVLLNVIIISWISVAVIRAELARKDALPPAPPVPEHVVKIFPAMFEQVPAVDPAEMAVVEPPKTVRTSADQESAEPPRSRRFIGERNTRATSDRPASDADPNLPSQAGREAQPEEQVETTESEYQDGKLEIPDTAAAAAESPPSVSTPTPALTETAPEMVNGEKSPAPGEEETAQTAIREKLLEGPNPVDTPVPMSEVKEDLKPREERTARPGETAGVAEKKVAQEIKPTPKPAPVRDPAFRGNQRRTAIQGSISRTGRSALDVVDTPMGRYQSLISRAVEKEWQINCVRHRDFITPGYLTVRFFVESDGKVKSVQFTGDIQTGEVQKGFTLHSIRNAGIPPMPAGVKKELEGDALELIFNFYF